MVRCGCGAIGDLMRMVILPAIDIREGRCVRLVQGARAAEVRYAADPVAVAATWQSMGAPWLHVVDLDGAFAGHPVQWELIARVIAAARVPVQVGGGFRTMDDVRRALDGGAARVVLGTAALRLAGAAAAAFDDRIAVSLDARDGRLLAEGWTASVGGDPIEVGGTLAAAGVRWFILTDVVRDGTMTGPNVDAVRAFTSRVSGSVIAAGGIAAENDLDALAAVGASGAILGRALYEGRLDLPTVLARWKGGHAH